MPEPIHDPNRPYLYFVSYFWNHDGDVGHGWRGVAASEPVTTMTGIEALIDAIDEWHGGGHDIVPLHFQLINGSAATRDEPCL